MSSHAIAPTLDGEHGGFVQQAVDDGTGHDLIGKDLSPISEATIPGEDDGALVVAPTDDLEDPVGRVLVHGEVAQFIDDQYRGTEIDAELVGRHTLEMCRLQGVHHIRC